METSKAEKISALLAITVVQLDGFAHDALVSDRPVVVACYLQCDVGEAKLRQINEHIPFIKGPCHWFDLQGE